MRFKILFKTFSFVFMFIFFIAGCGNKLDPSPLFPISHSKIEDEVEKRTSQEKNSDEQNNLK